TDACNNATSAAQKITVVDTTKPSLTVPSDKTVECSGDTSPAAKGQATGSDTCGAVTISRSDAFAPGCSNTGVITRTWTATDACNNATSATQKITVVDTTRPSLTVPSDKTVECTGDTTPATQGSATGSDTCGAVTISHTDGFAAGCGNTGVITRTWKATDACNNVTSGIQKITVVDTAKPSIIWPANTTVECTGDTTPATHGSATGRDSCGNVAISHSDAFAQGCGNTGVITRTWKATDGCGNTSSCVQSITLRDTTAPALTLPANLVLECPGDTRTNVTGVAAAQ